MSTVMSR